MNASASRAARRGGVNGINIVLGIWLILSPFVLGFARLDAAEWNNIAVGVAVVLVAVSGASWMNLVLGAWLILSPWVLGFAGDSTILWNNIVVGALVALVALSAGPVRTRDAGSPPPM